MASNKNQHFVPRCYLKEFTHDSENKAINVYNIDRDRCIFGSPVKNQCSRNYFYGTDEKLEKAIQQVEANYASALREIISGPRKLSEHQKIAIKRFWLLQYLRTESASKRAVEMSNDMTEVAGVEGSEYNLQIKDAVQIAMMTYAESMDIVDDLKTCLVLNKTDVPLVTSDDPAVLSNRWHLNDWRTKFRSFGLKTCGALFFLPLTPKVICIAYDGDVYSIPNKNGWTSVASLNDVKSFNQQQFLNCRANIFFRDDEHCSYICQSFKDVSQSRLAKRHRINYAVIDENNCELSSYKVVDPKEAEDHQEAIIHTETIHPFSKLWPSILRWRNKGAVYTNGTGVGYIRKAHAINEASTFYKEPIRLMKRLA